MWGSKELPDLKDVVWFVNRQWLPASFLRAFGLSQTPLGATSKYGFQDSILEILTESG